jgi:septum site-determining protein MinC
MHNNLLHKPIEIKISTVVAVSVILRELDPTVLRAALEEMTGGMRDFFDNEFAVIDIAALSHEQCLQIDWDALIALFKSYQLNPVAIRHAPPELCAGIIAHGLCLDGGAKERDTAAADSAPAAGGSPPAAIAQTPKTAAPAEQAAPASAPPAAASAPQAVPIMIIDTPVRAGQRIYAKGGDLIITAVVNNGAEVIADGSIHVYAPLRGRALAGASGNANARIFALSLEPELVSIAGMYRTFEDGIPAALVNQPAQVRLVGDRIELVAANAAK